VGTSDISSSVGGVKAPMGGFTGTSSSVEASGEDVRSCGCVGVGRISGTTVEGAGGEEKSTNSVKTGDT